jgi:hypothetical protein
MNRKLTPLLANGGGGAGEGASPNWLLARLGWFYGLASFVGALISLMAVVGFSLGITTYIFANYPLTQNVVTLSTTMPSRPLNHVLAGANPVTYYMPNDLSAFVGALYSIDCLTLVGHQVIITPGPLDTNFISGNRTATCPTGGVGGRIEGFSFRVVSPSRLRIISSTSGIVFS